MLLGFCYLKCNLFRKPDIILVTEAIKICFLVFQKRMEALDNTEIFTAMKAAYGL